LRLRIVTLNTWTLPWRLSRDTPRRMQAIAAQLPVLEADVIGFQEVWTRSAAQILLAGAERAGLHAHWDVPGSFRKSGLLVASRHPIERARFEAFALNGKPQRIQHSDYYGGKGFVRLELKTPGGRIDVVNTHLHAQYTRAKDDLYHGHRVGQMVQLVLALQKITAPLVAVGDFNAQEETPEYAVLRGLSGLRDVAAELDHRQMTVLAENPYRRSVWNAQERIDYIFVRHGVQTRVEPLVIKRVFDETLDFDGHAGTYSDHAGLVADVEITNGKTQPPFEPDPAAAARALASLREERAMAQQQQNTSRNTAGSFGLAAALALLSARSQALDRRRLVRGLLLGTGFAALPLGACNLAFSEHFIREELAAYDALIARLAQLSPVERPNPDYS